MRDYSSDNRTKFDFVVACGLAGWRMRMEWEGLLQDQVLLKELTMFGIYKDASRSKRWGEIPVAARQNLSLALEEVEEEIQK
jgi:hypothetical protein